jgi:hypothetical protein
VAVDTLVARSERQAKGADTADTLAESATHALDLIRKMRRAAADAAADPSRLRDNDGFRRE